MTELDLDAIEARWSTYGGMGSPRVAEDYTDAGCRIFAEHGFRDVPVLVARVRELEAEVKRLQPRPAWQDIVLCECEDSS